MNTLTPMRMRYSDQPARLRIWIIQLGHKIVAQVEIDDLMRDVIYERCVPMLQRHLGVDEERTKRLLLWLRLLIILLSSRLAFGVFGFSPFHLLRAMEHWRLKSECGMAMTSSVDTYAEITVHAGWQAQAALQECKQFDLDACVLREN